MTDRLIKADWLAEGSRTLTSEGVGGLKVGPMSQRLKVSRGSFYWHFADIADLRAQLLDHWRDAATEQVIARIESDTPADRFRVLMRRAFAHDRGLERAIRSWATTDADVALIVAEIDARRITFIARILTETGVSRSHSMTRARFAYWAYLGQPQMMDLNNAIASERQIDQISSLLASMEL